MRRLLRSFLRWLLTTHAPRMVCDYCLYPRRSARFDFESQWVICDECWASTPVPAGGRNAGRE